MAADHTGNVELVRALLGTFRDLRVTVEEVLETDDGAVAAIQVDGRMKGSEAELAMRLAIVYRVAGGKVVSGREYATREQALDAAGIQG